jgi:putative endonuclease
MPRRGSDAERRAANHYRLRGYRVLDRNAWCAGYELDLVVRRGRRLVFVEVKEKTGDGFGDPLEMVDDEKRRRVARAAEAWLARRPELTSLDVRLEAVGVRPDRVRRVSFE